MIYVKKLNLGNTSYLVTTKTGDLIPYQDLTFNLGEKNTPLRYKNIYANTLDLSGNNAGIVINNKPFKGGVFLSEVNDGEGKWNGNILNGQYEGQVGILIVKEGAV